MLGDFLAIDPSTTATGLVIFRNDFPVEVETVEQGGKDVLKRINAMIDAVVPYLYGHNLTAVVCENWQGSRNPQLQTLIKAIVNKSDEAGVPCVLYHNATICANIKPRGFRSKTTAERKHAMMTGVIARFPKVVDVFLTQHEYDAAAVGCCHIDKTREKLLEQQFGEECETLDRGNRN